MSAGRVTRSTSRGSGDDNPIPDTPTRNSSRGQGATGRGRRGSSSTRTGRGGANQPSQESTQASQSPDRAEINDVNPESAQQEDLPQPPGNDSTQREPTFQLPPIAEEPQTENPSDGQTNVPVTTDSTTSTPRREIAVPGAFSEWTTPPQVVEIPLSPQDSESQGEGSASTQPGQSSTSRNDQTPVTGNPSNVQTTVPVTSESTASTSGQETRVRFLEGSAAPQVAEIPPNPPGSIPQVEGPSSTQPGQPSTNRSSTPLHGEIVDIEIRDNVNRMSREERRQVRDRLLSELFHMQPILRFRYVPELQTLRAIQNVENFDLDGWLAEFQDYYQNQSPSNLNLLLSRGALSDNSYNLDLQGSDVVALRESQTLDRLYRPLAAMVLVFPSLDEEQFRRTIDYFNIHRPQDRSNKFCASAWLYLNRLWTRSDANPLEESIAEHAWDYILTYHNYPVMTSAFRSSILGRAAGLTLPLPLVTNPSDDDGGNRPSQDIANEVGSRSPSPSSEDTHSVQEPLTRPPSRRGLQPPRDAGGTSSPSQQGNSGRRSRPQWPRERSRERPTERPRERLNTNSGQERRHQTAAPRRADSWGPGYEPTRGELVSGWVKWCEEWWEIDQYRPIGSGYQINVKRPAANGYMEYRMIPAHLVGGKAGGRAIIEEFTEEALDQGRREADLLFSEGSIDKLIEASRQHTRIVGVSIHCRDVKGGYPYLNRNYMWVILQFPDDEGWYTTSHVREYLSEQFLQAELEDYHKEADLIPFAFIPDPTRCRYTSRDPTPGHAYSRPQIDPVYGPAMVHERHTRDTTGRRAQAPGRRRSVIESDIEDDDIEAMPPPRRTRETTGRCRRAQQIDPVHGAPRRTRPGRRHHNVVPTGRDWVIESDIEDDGIEASVHFTPPRRTDHLRRAQESDLEDMVPQPRTGGTGRRRRRRATREEPAAEDGINELADFLRGVRDELRRQRTSQTPPPAAEGELDEIVDFLQDQMGPPRTYQTPPPETGQESPTAGISGQADDDLLRNLAEQMRRLHR
ncbi:uncharacterized protein TRUGW13939_08825 [Talaromyces rugulosus]|uniref:Uncharacterized protein n=1 Tax=Talaromyces rugulosus TaxID=121627 RepID=A0A7H8R5M4_TALRU|nr:uncharacterized protein TRUGW13939_08825 [Talaromyces rugulosus]QKX61672.1 hypothetical protein TRUGW13939_08825 [Talaromyces rugulosus]